MTCGVTDDKEHTANGLGIEWGGKDSNLRPGDYERFSAARTGLNETRSNPRPTCRPDSIGDTPDHPSMRSFQARQYEVGVTAPPFRVLGGVV